MNSRRLILLFTITLVVIAVLAGSVVYQKNKKTDQVERRNSQVSAFAATSAARLASAVVTLPEGDILVGLENDKSTYKPANGTIQGTVNLLSRFLVTKFVPASSNGEAPRLDAIAPLFVMGDTKQGSMYVVLFQDRGDAAIEKSYVRLGGRDVVIEKIEIVPADGKDSAEEYRVSVRYRLEGRMEKTDALVSLPREAIVPVVDGHFDPKGLITKNL